ncbi:glycerol-3-phosphate dehydrogenase/oxidase (plasmid) [Rhizobium leguminosarum]|uniref:glycerol-3-phosphate dehydrogenase/oxidase n=1 Tax=Rhizobium TaxID=379 RepID=UPI001030FB35|nr:MULTISPECIES: glycerol-3-phosphate dehydrogenase/oxidase [Rhizobium]MBY5527070.1 glycerol-3-phosphate dehydrogenase/oxidase [Rhizobium leguminosarum]MCJ9690690.1 glycerol-3-phosphate dehydrogenase/oxidase [Rhizobium sp. PRIMUS64]NKK84820.1 FAD-dependent oxidoreductase [Rhizobium leguminosarum bv. viciae]QIO75209.1 glycerol-3-phosphate dehydrogenase/oxidase [Rhizobium leguminosarum bv. trifolii]QIO82224.1 glycerol-3-phosphate dehydrogenase/oxidase [Rhizobium leguminosarum bv. trifolii]
MKRQEILDGLRQSPKVDVCVIGGGINGISVFRELALQGLSVLLVEKHDYCSGASSALSRMVHGGLRYLENGEFKLVQESLVERDRLLRNAPHYVAPLPTTVPVFDIFSGLGNGIVRFLGLSRRPSRRGAVAIKAGLSIYDFLTRKRALMPRHQFRGRRTTLAKWPALNPDIKSSATYFDAWVSHPERLGIELLQDGLLAKFGAMALNYAELQRTEDGQYRVEDQIGGASVIVEPTLIINATGGWIDIANQTLFSPEARPSPLMGGTKGSHLIIDNADLRDALADHMIYYENEDGRICILFPYLGKVLVGSTDIRVDDPETVRCEADERDYILQSLAFVLPGIPIRPEQIVFQFSGVRPLPASTDSFTGRIPRDHFCTLVEPKDGGPPVLCMIGGKWTTFRSFGELAADMALARLGRRRRVATTDRPIGGGRAFPANAPAWLTQMAAGKGLSGGRMAELFARYGTDAEAIAGFIAAGPDAALPHAGYSMRELQFLIREEAVEHLDDLLLRRTTLAVLGELTLDMMDAALDLLAQEKRWTLAHRAGERDRFLTLLNQRHGVDEDMLSARNEPRSTECDTTAKSG